MTAFKKILPGATLGVVGGGQLGRMFCIAAQTLGYRVVVLDPADDCPAKAIANTYICANYDDQQALLELARQCEAVTIEFENVPAATLELLAQHTQVSPSAHPVSISQDRILEKQFFSSISVPTAPYAVIQSTLDVAHVAPQLLPGILKTARLGYDGKGQIRVNSVTELMAAFKELNEVPCVLESKLEIDYEISVIITRGFDGDMVHYPIAENVHYQGILAMSTIPARHLTHHLADQAISVARKIANGLNYHGVLCVEFFVLHNGQLVANEMAPRPHNSGHYTIDACTSSQFEQQVRAMTGMPLGCALLLNPTKMLNILGDSWFPTGAHQAVTPDWEAVLQIEAANLHLYGKAEPRKGRKMGHVTLTDRDTLKLDAAAKKIAEILTIKW